MKTACSDSYVILTELHSQQCPKKRSASDKTKNITKNVTLEILSQKYHQAENYRWLIICKIPLISEAISKAKKKTPLIGARLITDKQGNVCVCYAVIHLEKSGGSVNDATQDVLFHILHTRYYACADGETSINLKPC